MTHALKGAGQLCIAIQRSIGHLSGSTGFTHERQHEALRGQAVHPSHNIVLCCCLVDQRVEQRLRAYMVALSPSRSSFAESALACGEPVADRGGQLQSFFGGWKRRCRVTDNQLLADRL